MKPMMLAAAVAALLMSSAASAISTFAQFSQLGENDIMRFVNSANSGGNANAQLTSAVRQGNGYIQGAPIVSFKFLSGPDELRLQDAYFSFAAAATSAAQVFGGFTAQELASGTLAFTRVTPASQGSGNGNRTNLLTINFTNATILGSTNTSAASLTASTFNGATVTMTSDFFTFDSTVNRDLSLSFSSLTPTLLRAAFGDNLRSFTADATGTFSSDPAPRYVNEVPEPAMLGLFGIGFTILAFARRRQRS